MASDKVEVFFVAEQRLNWGVWRNGQLRFRIPGKHMDFDDISLGYYTLKEHFKMKNMNYFRSGKWYRTISCLAEASSSHQQYLDVLRRCFCLRCSASTGGRLRQKSTTSVGTTGTKTTENIVESTGGSNLEKTSWTESKTWSFWYSVRWMPITSPLSVTPQ